MALLLLITDIWMPKLTGASYRLYIQPYSSPEWNWKNSSKKKTQMHLSKNLEWSLQHGWDCYRETICKRGLTMCLQKTKVIFKWQWKQVEEDIGSLKELMKSSSSARSRMEVGSQGWGNGKMAPLISAGWLCHKITPQESVCLQQGTKVTRRFRNAHGDHCFTGASAESMVSIDTSEFC